MNTINIKNNKDEIIYTLRGPLNFTLKSKLKNKTSKILNNSNIPRNLSKLYITKENSTEVFDLLETVYSIKPDILLPAVQITILYNKLDTNILTNSKKGTYIKVANKNKYFDDIGNPTKSFSDKYGYFLSKGAAYKLLTKAINDMRDKGIKTIFVHPLNKDLEIYYKRFGFIPIKNVPLQLGRKQYYESIGGSIMYLEL
jgi:hypothetical protein